MFSPLNSMKTEGVFCGHMQEVWSTLKQTHKIMLPPCEHKHYWVTMYYYKPYIATAWKPCYVLEKGYLDSGGKVCNVILAVVKMQLELLKIANWRGVALIVLVEYIHPVSCKIDTHKWLFH